MHTTHLLIALSGIILVNGTQGATQATSQDKPYLAAVVTARTGAVENLKRSLASIAELADLIVVHRQKGSQPAALPDARKLLQHDISWMNSFSEARNLGLLAAQAAGAAWALVLDDCEELQLESPAASVIRVLAQTQHPVLHLYDQANRPYTRPRFIKLPAQGRFEGPVQEIYVEEAQDPSKDQLLTGAAFARQDRLDVTSLQDQERSMLTLHLAEGPATARSYYYFGSVLRDLQKPEQCGFAMWQSSLLSRDPGHAAWALYEAALCFKGNWDPTPEKLSDRMLERAYDLHPGMPEISWLLSFNAYQASRFADAVRWAELAASVGCVTDRNCALYTQKGYRHVPAWFSGPYDVLQYAYRKLGNASAAALATQQYEAAQAKQQAYVQQPVMGLYHASIKDW